MRKTVQQSLMLGRHQLEEAGIENAAKEARLLMAKALNICSSRITLCLQDTFDGNRAKTREAWLAYHEAINKRCERIPMSHLLGGREFYGRWFKVGARVLDPRPETETLIEAALSEQFQEVLDLGTGSGCILLTLLAERPAATGIGADISTAALTVAEANAQALGVETRCGLIDSNWFERVSGQFDLIVSNPPYIAAAEMEALAPELGYEPRMALTDEGDGLSAYRAITAGADAHLKQGGHLMVEIGWTQGRAVAEMYRQAGFRDVVILPDLDGRDRVVRGIWRG